MLHSLAFTKVVSHFVREAAARALRGNKPIQPRHPFLLEGVKRGPTGTTFAIRIQDGEIRVTIPLFHFPQRLRHT